MRVTLLGHAALLVEMGPIPGKPLTLGEKKIFPTQSENRDVRECGIVFRDESGTFWNQVDTEISPATVHTVLHKTHLIQLFGGWITRLCR